MTSEVVANRKIVLPEIARERDETQVEGYAQALSPEPAPWSTPILAEKDVAQDSKRFELIRRWRGPIHARDEDIDDWLGEKPWHRSATHMLDSSAATAEDRFNIPDLLRVDARPLSIVRDNRDS